MTESRRVSDLPPAIGLPYQHVRQGRGSPEARLRDLLFTGYQALRYTGILLLADYLEGEALEPRVSRYIAGLAVPHFSGWYQLVNALCKRVPLRLTPLVDAWRRMRADTGGVTVGLPALTPSEPSNPLTALWQARNRHAHGGLSFETVAPERLAETLAALLPVLDRLIELLEPGFRAGWLEGEGLETALVTPHCRIPTGPLAQRFEDDPDPVRLLDGFRRRAVILSGVSERTEHPELVSPLATMLSSKHAAAGLRGELTEPEAVLAACRTGTVIALEELFESGYDLERRIHRAVDDQLASELACGEGALLLRGAAGTGKTSVMVQACQAALDDGQAVVLLRGGADFETEGQGSQRLAAALRRGLGWQPRTQETHREVLADVASLWERWESPPSVRVFVDALDEAPKFGAVLAALDDLAATARLVPWLRVVVSMREGSWATLSSRERLLNRQRSLPLANPKAWFQREDELSDDVSSGLGIVVEGLNDTEARSLYQRGAQGRDLPPWELLPAETRSALCNPLLSRMGVSLPRTSLGAVTGAASLFRAYLDELERGHPQLADTLLDVADRLQRDRVKELDPEWIHSQLERWRARTGQTGPSDVLFFDPFELLRSASVLAPTGEGRWRFRHERMSEAVLARWLDAQGHEDLFPLSVRAENEAELRAALALHAVQLVERGQYGPLRSLLRPVFGSLPSAVRVAWGDPELTRFEWVALAGFLCLLYATCFVTRLHKLADVLSTRLIARDAGFGALVAALQRAYSSGKSSSLLDELTPLAHGDWWRGIRLASALRGTADRFDLGRRLAVSCDVLEDAIELEAKMLADFGWGSSRIPRQLLALDAVERARLLDKQGLGEDGIALRAAVLQRLGVELEPPQRGFFGLMYRWNEDLQRRGVELGPPTRRLFWRDYELRLVLEQLEAVSSSMSGDDAEALTLLASLDALAREGLEDSEGRLRWDDDAIDCWLRYLDIEKHDRAEMARERVDALMAILRDTLDEKPGRAALLAKAMDLAAELEGSSVARHRQLELLLSDDDTPTWRILSVAKELAERLVEDGEEDEAIATLRGALEYRDQDDLDPYWVGDVLHLLGNLTKDLDILAEAVRMFEIDRDPDEKPSSVWLALEDLSDQLEARSRVPEAALAALEAAGLRQDWADARGGDPDEWVELGCAWMKVRRLATDAEQRGNALNQARRALLRADEAAGPRAWPGGAVLKPTPWRGGEE